MTTYRAPYLDETGPLTLPPTRRRKLSVKLVEVFIFVAPLLQFVQLRVVGLLFGTGSPFRCWPFPWR